MASDPFIVRLPPGFRNILMKIKADLGISANSIMIEAAVRVINDNAELLDQTSKHTLARYNKKREMDCLYQIGNTYAAAIKIARMTAASNSGDPNMEMVRRTIDIHIDFIRTYPEEMQEVCKDSIQNLLQLKQRKIVLQKLQGVKQIEFSQ